MRLTGGPLESQFAANANTWHSPDPIKLSISRSRYKKRVSGPAGPCFDEYVEPYDDDSNISLFLFMFQDSHGIEMKAAPVADTSQDVRVLGGSQNETHTTVMFARKWQTCDPQDHQLTVSLKTKT